MIYIATEENSFFMAEYGFIADSDQEAIAQCDANGWDFIGRLEDVDKPADEKAQIELEFYSPTIH